MYRRKWTALMLCLALLLPLLPIMVQNASAAGEPTISIVPKSYKAGDQVRFLYSYDASKYDLVYGAYVSRLEGGGVRHKDTFNFPPGAAAGSTYLNTVYGGILEITIYARLKGGSFPNYKYDSASDTVNIEGFVNESAAVVPSNIQGNAYYKNGQRVRGWLFLAPEGYLFFDNTGVMKKGWILDAGKWYFLDPSTFIMRTGWVKDGGKWYYLSSSGAMQTGWVKDGGKWYYLSSSGAMKTGWVKDGGTWYYMNSSGAMHTGWLQTGGGWYYLSGSGAMLTGTHTVDGRRSAFGSDGLWLGYR